MSWQDYQLSGVSGGPSSTESDRFNLAMGRVTVGVDAPPSAHTTLIATVRSLNLDVTVVRFPAGSAWVPAALGQTGYTVIPAGTLMYWEHDAQRPLRDVVLNPSLSASTGSSCADLPSLVSNVVRQSFSGYGNHYSVNPLLDRNAALAGYIEWAARSATADADNVVLLMNEMQPVGVATYEVNGPDAEVLLAGLVPSAQGKRWYSALLEGVRRHAAVRDCRRLIISTQAHNFSVQRAWVRLGLRPFGAIETVHLISSPTGRDPKH